MRGRINTNRKNATPIGILRKNIEAIIASVINQKAITFTGDHEWNIFVEGFDPRFP